MKQFYFLVLIFLAWSCKKKEKTPSTLSTKNTIEIMDYAKGFFIEKNKTITKINVINPWPNATDTLSYYIVPKNIDIPNNISPNEVIRTPIEKIIVTATTDIPLLEALNVEKKLIGFPETNYVSSQKTRHLIDSNLIKDIGSLQALNIELVLNLNPELIIGFSSSGGFKNFNLFKRSGIPILMNGSWLESHPLGRAEWIKVMGYLFNKEKEATAYFNVIKKQYEQALAIAKTATVKPTVLSGNMYKDVWYVPRGNSYAAKLIADANGNYLWNNDTKTGSLALSFEAVYQKAKNATIWIGGGNFNTTKALSNFEEKYQLFDAFKNKNVYSKDLKKGKTGGILYYEQGSLRADWVLKDLIKIFHPNLVPNYKFHFYQKLK